MGSDLSSARFIYTLCFLTRGDTILMLHRRRPPNQGLWNGVGGRIEAGESPLDACLREVREETGYRLTSARFDGLLSWSGHEFSDGGLYMYTAEAPEGEPQACAEGALVWKRREWVYTSSAVVSNLHYVVPLILGGAPPQRYHFWYSSGQITHHVVEPLPAWARAAQVGAEGMIESTLCLPVAGGSPVGGLPTEVLLGLKKVGFGAGKITGFGGKVEPGETVEAAARRELAEEAGLLAAESDLRPAGRLIFRFPARPSWSQVVHLFLVASWDGTPVESDEMQPAWFRVDALPFAQMWQDAPHWLPRILAGERLDLTFVFQDDNESIQMVEERR